MGIENTHERGPRRARRHVDNSFTPLVEIEAAPGGAAAFEVQGNTAHGAPAVGNGVRIAGKAVASLPAAVDAGDVVDPYFDLKGRLHVKAGGISDVIDVTVTRPDNATQYSANDIIGDVSGDGIFVIPNAALELGGTGSILNLVLLVSAVEAVKPNLEVWFFDTRPALIADNAPFAITDPEIKRCLGVLDLDGVPLETANNLLYRVVSFNPIVFRCLAGSRDLYGALVEKGTYTPVASEVYTLRVGVGQD